MYEFSYYTFCHPEYFETLSRYRATPVYRDILLTLLPESWTLTRSDIWIHARSRSTRIESQGFKIHISASISQAESVLQRIVPVCVNAGASFKIVVDPTVHRFLNSKRFHRSGSGKFATIYSPSETSFRHMVEELRQATADLEGPYILSDRRYKDSKIVFYRYGGFESIPDLQADGTKQLMIRDQDGKLVPDQRQPYFDLPAWISDPFVESEPSAAGGADANGLLRDRYEVLEALNFTNTGGVYRAVDHTSGRMVVIKEARPHTLNWIRRDQTIDATAALSHEHACLQMLQGLSCVPEVIEFYQECKSEGINPVVGYEAYVAPQNRRDREARRRLSSARGRRTLVTAWNKRQARRMPLLFAPTIGAETRGLRITQASAICAMVASRDSASAWTASITGWSYGESKAWTTLSVSERRLCSPAGRARRPLPFGE